MSRTGSSQPPPHSSAAARPANAEPSDPTTTQHTHSQGYLITNLLVIPSPSPSTPPNSGLHCSLSDQRTRISVLGCPAEEQEPPLSFYCSQVLVFPFPDSASDKKEGELTAWPGYFEVGLLLDINTCLITRPASFTLATSPFQSTGCFGWHRLTAQLLDCSAGSPVRWADPRIDKASPRSKFGWSMR